MIKDKNNTKTNKHLKAPKPHNARKDAVYSKEARILDEKPQLIDGYKDASKVFHADMDKAIRERIRRMKEKFPLPVSIKTLLTGSVSDVLVINKSGRSRELLPDIPPCHVMLCHANIARLVKSGIGIFVRVTSADDGSWVLAPEAAAMLNATTVQHIRRRSWWFLRRYSYEISFDGRVEPAMMLFDYGLDPTKEQQRFFCSTEKVRVRDTDKYNTYFRFWLDRANIFK